MPKNSLVAALTAAWSASATSAAARPPRMPNCVATTAIGSTKRMPMASLGAGYATRTAAIAANSTAATPITAAGCSSECPAARTQRPARLSTKRPLGSERENRRRLRPGVQRASSLSPWPGGESVPDRCRGLVVAPERPEPERVFDGPQQAVVVVARAVARTGRDHRAQQDGVDGTGLGVVRLVAGLVERDHDEGPVHEAGIGQLGLEEPAEPARRVAQRLVVRVVVLVRCVEREHRERSGRDVGVETLAVDDALTSFGVGTDVVERDERVVGSRVLAVVEIGRAHV